MLASIILFITHSLEAQITLKTEALRKAESNYQQAKEGLESAERRGVWLTGQVLFIQYMPIHVTGGLSYHLSGSGDAEFGQRERCFGPETTARDRSCVHIKERPSPS